MPAHPTHVLFDDEPLPALLPVCDHYAGNLKFLYKATALQQQLGPVFDITCDLEDGAAAMTAADTLVLAAEFAGVVASAHNAHGRIGVRVHPVSDPRCEAEVELLLARCGQRLPYLMLPKARSAADVRQFCDLVRRTALALGLAHPTRVHALIETPGALRDVFDIAALPLVESLSFGLMDYVSAHHGAIPAQAMRSPAQFEHPLVRRAKAEIAAACHTYGKVPSHNVCVDVQDAQAAGDDATLAQREWGYARMWSIHPAQIEPIVRALSPSAQGLLEAEDVIAQALAADWAPVAVAGRLHDRASYRLYWTMLSRANAAGYQAQRREIAALWS